MIVDSFGSPTIQNDLDVFDAQWGIPDTTVQIEQAGVIPPFDPTDGTRVGWAQETTLDVEYAHAIAPGEWVHEHNCVLHDFQRDYRFGEDARAVEEAGLRRDDGGFEYFGGHLVYRMRGLISP